MDAGKEIQGEGEEKLDYLFTYKEGDEATYFVSEGQELDVEHFGRVATTLEKGEVATRNMNLKTWRFWKFLKKEDRQLSHMVRNHIVGRLSLKLLLLRYGTC